MQKICTVHVREISLDHVQFSLKMCLAPGSTRAKNAKVSLHRGEEHSRRYVLKKKKLLNPDGNWPGNVPVPGSTRANICSNIAYICKEHSRRYVPEEN